MKTNTALTLAMLSVAPLIHAQDEDQYIWLEEVDGAKALEFVNNHNRESTNRLSQVKEYNDIYTKSLEIYNSNDRIVYPTIYGEFIYNFWQDKEHVRGIWRRTPKFMYFNGTPSWETLLDLDAMSKADSVKWVFKGAAGLFPSYHTFLVSLSKGGGDAVVVKEFDVMQKEFVKDGFSLPESKSFVSYLNDMTAIVGTNFGDKSMTTSGYPRQVKLWSRGTPLSSAKLIFEGAESDVLTSGYVLRDGMEDHVILNRAITFYESEVFLWKGNKATKLDIPKDADISDILRNQLIVTLKSDWTVEGTTYESGSLISLDFAALAQGKKKIQRIITPDKVSSISSVATTQSKLLVNMLNNVKNELYMYALEDEKWVKNKVPAPELGTIIVNATDEFSDVYFFTYHNFLTPTTLYMGNAVDNTIKSHKSLPAFFDASKYKVEQLHARSADGTQVPYFVVSAKNIKLNGKNPTLLYAYGGFEVSMLPSYSGVLGKAWLENGGVYVLANIRGGGEFGPNWHNSGIKEKRQNVYNDFHSVAEDLIKRKITSSNNLGIMGGSNGGLLMGVAFTQRPDLYKAVVCQVPLLDMKRYNKLLAGASWMGEYGDPDKPEEWDYISKYSPYHNIKKGGKYPEVFFTTSTRDDRVHPGHARKMVAKMEAMGYPVYYYENTEGGHAGSSTNEQRAKTAALQYSYLLMKLKG
jgi:prolyl oligopeptidase